MTDQARPAMTMRQIREGLGHVQPGQPDVIVSVTRYTVSLLPADDVNHRYFALFVELKPRGWLVHNGHEFYASDGTWQPSQSMAHYFADCDEALAFARESAPDVTVNGFRAADLPRRPAASA